MLCHGRELDRDAKCSQRKYVKNSGYQFLVKVSHCKKKKKRKNQFYIIYYIQKY